MRPWIVVCTAFCLVISGCAILKPQYEKRETLADIMKSNMGSSYDSIVMAEGIPTRSHQMDDGGMIAEWVRDLGAVTYVNRNFMNGQVLGSNSYGRVCVLRYMFRNKVATNWGYEGYC